MPEIRLLSESTSVSSAAPWRSWRLGGFLLGIAVACAVLGVALRWRGHSPLPDPLAADGESGYGAAAAPAAAAPGDGRLSLGERLAPEASSRAPGGLRVEAAAQALSAGGVALGPLRQVLARTVGARYCAAARSAAGSVVALCEFADDATAARGLDYSRATFDRLMPGRRLARARNLILTMTPAAPGAAFDADAGRAAAVLATL